MHTRQREVERRRHAVELERVDEQAAVADLAPGAGAEKAAQLGMQVATTLRGLVLEAAERRELASTPSTRTAAVPRARISSSSRSASQA